MKINGEFIIREFNGTVYAVAVGENSEKFKGAIKLNTTSRLLWEKLSTGATEDELVAYILEEYDIEKTTAVNDIIRFIVKMKAANLITE